jgi:hypothetical protein
MSRLRVVLGLSSACAFGLLAGACMSKGSPQPHRNRFTTVVNGATYVTPTPMQATVIAGETILVDPSLGTTVDTTMTLP